MATTDIERDYRVRALEEYLAAIKPHELALEAAQNAALDAFNLAIEPIKTRYWETLQKGEGR